MSGLLGGLIEGLFGKPEAPKADWAEIEKLMRLSTELNRTNQNGILSGWNWSEGPNGWTQNQTINPGLQPAVDKFMGRMGEGEDPQLKALRDARFQAMMNQQGAAPRPPQLDRNAYITGELQRGQ